MRENLGHYQAGRVYNAMIVSPLRTTWKRYLTISASPYTLLRALEYERISGQQLIGKTMDLGGGEGFSYYSRLLVEGVVETTNNNQELKPTHLLDLDAPLPLPTASYDNVLSFNTFEHLQNDEIAVREMIRVLKPGGSFFIFVPFLHPVHGKYGDYHRHTAMWWNNFFCALGLIEETFTIEPLVWDPLTTALNLLGLLRGRMLKRIFLLPAVLRHSHLPETERLPDPLGRRYATFALSYFIYGTKREH